MKKILLIIGTWPEAIDSGVVKLVVTETDSILSNASRLLVDTDYYKNMSQYVSPYGDGQASERKVNYLSYNL